MMRMKWNETNYWEMGFVYVPELGLRYGGNWGLVVGVIKRGFE